MAAMSEKIAMLTGGALYAVLPSLPDGESDSLLAAMARAAMDGGAAVLQYRDKNANAATARRRAFLLARLCRRRALLIVNDDYRLAMEAEADGVHLGPKDGGITAARKFCGAHAVIGASCRSRPTMAREAAASGADYCAVGAMFPSPTKPKAPLCPHSVVAEAKRIGGLPVVAIGGIHSQNAAEIVAAGADAIAVCSGLFGDEKSLESPDNIAQNARNILSAAAGRD